MYFTMGRSDILCSMVSRISQFVAVACLLICLLCPILETFDHWDHTAKTGSDTEYTFVVLGLCIGATYVFARGICKLAAAAESVSRASHARVRTRVVSLVRGLPFIFSIPISPPLNALRI